MDKIHLWYMRMILGIKKNSSVLITLGESGSLPPSTNIITNCINYAIRINNAPRDTLISQAHHESKRLHSMGFTTWYTKLLKIVQEYGIILDNNPNKNDVKQIVYNKFTHDWKTAIMDIDKHPLLRTYTHIKFEFKIESFLMLVNDARYRTAMARFRSSSHNLEIERGRHTRPITPIQNRLCTNCNTIENEIHFLTECKILETERVLLYQQILQKFPDFSYLDNFCKFQFMLTFHDKELLNLVAKFIFVGLGRRRIE